MDINELIYKKEISAQLARLIICGNKILTLSEETETHYIGFDCITEDAVMVPKDKAMFIPDVVVKLLGDEELRLRLANHISQHRRVVTAQLLNMADRSVYRLLQKYSIEDLMSEDEINGNITVKQIKKINKDAKQKQEA